MSREFSLYLDALRFLAALMVVVYHMNMRWLSTEILPLSGHGHAAVMVFFVLSGYVISTIHAKRENTPAEYWASRLSRFYSLAIPVVLATPLLDLAGAALRPDIYQGWTTHGLAPVRIATSLAWLNEVWTISIMSFSNTPYWSLCYEMWYYIMFAVCVFTAGRTRVLLLAGCALVVGPKILLLAPVWAMGVVVHRWRLLQRTSFATGLALFLGSIVAFGLFQHYRLTDLGSAWMRSLVGETWHHQLTFSRFALTDYLLGMIVAAHFVGARAVAPMLLGRILVPLERPIRWLAGYTFSLYLMHQPLLLFFGAAIGGDPAGYLYFFEVLGAILVTVWLAGSITEGRRHLLRARLLARLQSLQGSRWLAARGAP
ncbi:acyltransferase family protein [Pseudoduganella albidiflava]|uniref:Acyltransferase n=1 Tax=Pseudoduganella albidiflava TaxID=321983 RepID=A0A411X5P1_9BURK|nr:acyltransferase [Pseudoduganella albidiflava]QBI04212.1 acyltransferase [Pseudoduganella albidiflava]GGY25510.1 acyltransferase [Pseudoduganella albidiflava]